MSQPGPRRPRPIVAACLIAALLASIGPRPGEASPPPPQAGGGEQRPRAQWAEVLTATDKWLVLRNRDGEQYPVAFEAIGTFIVRWPTTLDRISPAALLEVTGRNAQANRILTDQVDVFEGASRNLVTPGLLTMTNEGYPITPIDFTINVDAYGAPFPGLDNPIQGGQQAPAGLIHLVGPMVGAFPLRVGIPLQSGLPQSNNAFTIMPPVSGLNLSQVTVGSPGMVQEGDLVFFVASEARPRSLIVPQLVVYKPMPLDRYNPPPRR